ncbi:DNA polymerase zeta processivity subunit isoform X2 [Sesamum indicum]|uniref:DNA polymerase zeta processivity subunit isoform X2 n=1 Tax=Sesamum indicum TaxID=4182 RepID=A0A6I9U9J3_SESIN|nr:DNA polymerase zeta processivity subunit isoform X2 [Sesamum indicum]
MDRKDLRTPQGEIARILVEFLEVAITSVIFLKGIYPNGAFERRRYMNVVVHKARHPQLNEYIHTAVVALLPFINKVEGANLEFSLRSFLIKLPVSEPLTKVLPRNCRWEIMAYFRSLPEASTSKDAEMWIPTDTKQWQQPPTIIPIKSMSSEPLGLQLYLEHPSLSEPKNEEK